MPKNIVFCADGTWNGTGGPEEIAGTDATNVLKLFRSLEGAGLGDAQGAEMEISAPATDIKPEQRAKYLHGVGDSSNMLEKLAQGSLGLGLIARVLRGYTFISRNFAPGDKIFITGFSRGAYTARALGGLIAGMGLLDWKVLKLNPGGSDDEGYKYAASAWFAYQRSRSQLSEQSSLIGRVQSAFAGAPQFISWLAYKPVYVSDVKIAAIGVFDTVGALGIPVTDQADTVRLDLLRFADTALSSKVAKGYHAIAADEKRVDFSPTLWDDRSGVVQQFFPGAHSDVGGGYPISDGESHLSDVAGAWMQKNLADEGVRFTNALAFQDADALGPMHAPWLAVDFFKRPTASRIFPPKSKSEITCHSVVGHRLGETVTTVNPNSSSLNTETPYVPVALINAGYVSVQGIALVS